MAETLYTVYMHTAPSGKSYIGITKNSITKRIGGGYRHNKYLTAAIKKYGWSNIETELIAENVSLDEANLLEAYYIASFETQDHTKGYNICDGGLSWNSQADEVRKKMSEAAKRRQHVPMGEETKRKIMMANKRRKRVECVETGEIFYSIGEAARSKGIERRDISRCIKGKRKTVGKYHWRIYDGRTTDVSESA